MTDATASPGPARPNQQAVIHPGTRQLRPHHSRALITSACGTGKTLTAIRILNVFQTLNLLAQTRPGLARRPPHRTHGGPVLHGHQRTQGPARREHRRHKQPKGLARAPEWIAELEPSASPGTPTTQPGRPASPPSAHLPQQHGHLAIPKTEPGGAFLADQRSLAGRGELDQQLPHNPDWTRKYHALRAYIQAGNDPAAISKDTVIGVMKAGNWLRDNSHSGTAFPPASVNSLPRSTSPPQP